MFCSLDLAAAPSVDLGQRIACSNQDGTRQFLLRGLFVESSGRELESTPQVSIVGRSILSCLQRAAVVPA